MPNCRIPLLLALLAVGYWVPARAQAGSVVIANRTPNKLSFQLVDARGESQSYNLNSGDVCSLGLTDLAVARFTVGEEPRNVRVVASCVYCFVADKAGSVDLFEIGLTMQPGDKPQPTQPLAVTPAVVAQPATAVATTKPLTIPVKVLVDDDERTARNVWRGRLTRRIQAVSDILEQHCHVRLEIVAFEEWVTNNRIIDFNTSLTEFEVKVQPHPARVAIGFTSQYEIPKGTMHLGGTRAALHSHILIREHSNEINEPERLEVLLHEVGHFLGAVHSRDADSVMRPILGDRQARVKDFRIGFDPVNTLAMSLLADDYRTKPVRSLAELPLPTRQRLCDIYTTLGRAFPKDPTPDQYKELLQIPGKP